jgi:hypothetical protein
MHVDATFKFTQHTFLWKFINLCLICFLCQVCAHKGFQQSNIIWILFKKDILHKHKAYQQMEKKYLSQLIFQVDMVDLIFTRLQLLKTEQLVS